MTVMAQKRKKRVKKEEQEILIKNWRLSSGYENVWNSKLTVLRRA